MALAKVVVLGAGPMGLAVAYQALQDGDEVDVLEASQEAGGMAGHFDFGGISIERFYHFVCRADTPTVTLLRELGIAHKLRWKPTSMAFYFDGRLTQSAYQLTLLSFPNILLATKLQKVL